MKGYPFLIYFILLFFCFSVFATEEEDSVAPKPEQQLFLAAWHGYSDVVQDLLSKGVKANIRDRKGNTPIVYAVEKGHAVVVNYLLSKGADPKAIDDQGNSLIMIAAERGDGGIIYDLLDAGANPNVVADGGVTALMKAAYGGHPAAVEILLQGGADREIRDIDGTSARDYAKAEIENIDRLLQKLSDEAKRAEMQEEREEYQVIVELLSHVRVYPQ
jgi:ankyrin repeat protein